MGLTDSCISKANSKAWDSEVENMDKMETRNDVIRHGNMANQGWV